MYQPQAPAAPSPDTPRQAMEEPSEECLRLILQPEYDDSARDLRIEDDHRSGTTDVSYSESARGFEIAGSVLHSGSPSCSHSHEFIVVFPFEPGLPLHFRISRGLTTRDFRVRVRVSSFPCRINSVTKLEDLNSGDLTHTVQRALSARLLYYRCRRELNFGHHVTLRAHRNWLDANDHLVKRWSLFAPDPNLVEVTQAYLRIPPSQRTLAFATVNPRDGYLSGVMSNFEVLQWRDAGAVQELSSAGEHAAAYSLNEELLNEYGLLDRRLRAKILENWAVNEEWLRQNSNYLDGLVGEM